jgi:mono/diheme cytochrome c family protein
MSMESLRRVAGATLVLAAALSSLAVLSAQAGPSKGNPANGKVIFTKKVCAQCHKADGSGGVKLTGNPSPSWKDKKRMATVTDDFIRDCITNGKIKSGMVAWGKTGQIKPAEIEDLIAYIRTFAK